MNPELSKLRELARQPKSARRVQGFGRELIDAERKAAAYARELRECNREIFGVFRWRYRLDVVLGWLQSHLPQRK